MYAVCSIYLGEESIREEDSWGVLRGILGHKGEDVERSGEDSWGVLRGILGYKGEDVEGSRENHITRSCMIHIAEI